MRPASFLLAVVALLSAACGGAIEPLAPPGREPAPLPVPVAPGGYDVAIGFQGVAAELECPDTNGCVEPYYAFLGRPEVLENAPRIDNCEEVVEEWVRAAIDDRELIDGLPPMQPGETLGDEILQTTRMDFLFDPAAFWARSLTVVERSREDVISDAGVPYELREVLLIDPLVGQVQVEHLLPLPRTGPVPTVVILPGHREDAATHRLQRFGQYLPERGFAVVIVSFRAWDQRADADATEAMLCQGMSMMLLRGYEAMLAMKLALASPESRNQPIGLLGHSGGSMVGNLLAWLPVNPARVHVSDLFGDYRNAGPADDNLPAVDCATHPALSLLSRPINQIQYAPIPVYEVPYGYAVDEEQQDSDPDPRDPAPLQHFAPVFEAFLLGQGS
jgi:hypothetical protein